MSCGTTAFGDVRFNCTGGMLGRCPETTAVTVRDAGRIATTVTTVSGEREGDRRLSAGSELKPGQDVTLRPGRALKYLFYLFDILVRSATDGAGAIEVVDVD
ncbi:hypothetical protein [Streptomyces sp. NPDC001792]|uniref:hypothetical protein n=1 Tax=unclassified Streptomyces TaxID=2593676 RepID=UPI003331BCEB